MRVGCVVDSGKGTKAAQISSQYATEKLKARNHEIDITLCVDIPIRNEAEKKMTKKGIVRERPQTLKELM